MTNYCLACLNLLSIVYFLLYNSLLLFHRRHPLWPRGISYLPPAALANRGNGLVSIIFGGSYLYMVSNTLERGLISNLTYRSLASVQLSVLVLQCRRFITALWSTIGSTNSFWSLHPWPFCLQTLRFWWFAPQQHSYFPQKPKGNNAFPNISSLHANPTNNASYVSEGGRQRMHANLNTSVIVVILYESPITTVVSEDLLPEHKMLPKHTIIPRNDRRRL